MFIPFTRKILHIFLFILENLKFYFLSQHHHLFTSLKSRKNTLKFFMITASIKNSNTFYSHLLHTFIYSWIHFLFEFPSFSSLLAFMQRHFLFTAAPGRRHLRVWHAYTPKKWYSKEKHTKENVYCGMRSIFPSYNISNE